MDTKTFFNIVNDKDFQDYKKLSYKYSDEINDFFALLSEYYIDRIPLPDFSGNDIGYISLLCRQEETLTRKLGVNHVDYMNLEQEIISTSAIENVDTHRESVRRILKGSNPVNDEENRIFGLKKGFEFISNTANRITEENIYKLYMMAIGEYLDEDSRLPLGKIYRDSDVYIVGNKVDHIGLPASKLPQYMSKLVKFINCSDGIPSAVKASIIHFYISYIHPYSDGNGRMARLVHLWFLVQMGYPSALFIPFSSNIEKSRKGYYRAFTVIEENCRISGVLDVTPFIGYITENVYDKFQRDEKPSFVIPEPERFTAKEHELWKYVTAYYGTDEFSTKQLEKDSGIAAYATVRDFVLKFTDAGLLEKKTYSNRNRYRIKQ